MAVVGRIPMRRVWMTGLLASTLLSGVSGCFVNLYSAEPIRRYRQLERQSEDLAMLEDDWERFWQIDRPSYLSWHIYNGFGDPAAKLPPRSQDDPILMGSMRATAPVNP